MAVTGTVAPFPYHQFFDSNGLVLTGGKLFTYAPGTTTKQTTYSDAGLTTPNTNPIVLDSAGRAKIFLPNNSFKFVLSPASDTDPPTSPIWTIDNVFSVPIVSTNTDVVDTIGDIVAIGQCLYLSDGSGGKTAGSWYLADSANPYSSSTATMIGFAVTSTTAINQSGTVRIAGQGTAFSGLAPGTTYYIASAGALTSTAPLNARQVLIADTTTSGITGPVRQATVGGQIYSNTPQFYPGSSAPGGGGISIASGVINAQTNAAGVGNSGAGETTLFSYTLPANSLNAASKALRVTAFGTIANNAAAKTIKNYFGATSGAISLQASISSYWFTEMFLTELSSTTQVALIKGGPNTAPAGISVVGITPGETLTGTVVIKVTGQATSNNDILCNGFIVEVVGA